MNIKQIEKLRAKKPQKRWDELELKSKSNSNLSDTKLVKYKMPLAERTKNGKQQKSIVDIINEDKNTKIMPMHPQNKHRKVMRISAQVAWERCQRATQIGKKSTRKINKVSEKKYYVAEGHKK